MIDKVEAYCLHYGLIHDGDKIIVACSGGPDSLALLDILSRLREKYHLHLTACYIHHGIRRAADQEVDFVRQQALVRQCDFAWHYVNVPALSAFRHESEEVTGREERYRLLRRTAEDCGASAIAVAHHRNDQAETVLFHLLRGSGLTGLGAMKPRSGCIIRPFLAVTREDILSYGKAHQLTPCIDETNTSRAYMRNRIRLDLIPLLREYNPAVIDDLDRLASIVRADDDFIQGETERRYNRYVIRQTDFLALPKKTLLAEPLAIQRRLVRCLIGEWKRSCLDIPFVWVETVLKLAAKGAGKEFRTKLFRAYTTYDDVCVGTAVPRLKKTISTISRIK